MAEEQGLIVLMEDIQVEDKNGIVVPVGHTKTFELNGHAILFTANLEGATSLIKNNGTLTIQDATDINKDGTGTGLISNIALNPDTDWDPENDNDSFPTYGSHTIENLGTLTIESGKYENRTKGGAPYVVDVNSNNRNATLTVNGGKLEHKADNFAVRLFANSVNFESKVVVNGGIIKKAFSYASEKPITAILLEFKNQSVA